MMLASRVAVAVLIALLVATEESSALGRILFVECDLPDPAVPRCFRCAEAARPSCMPSPPKAPS
jgi:Mrp family chromosome partitioning ATPase